MRPVEGSSFWSQSDYDEREEFARSVKVSLLGVSPRGVASFQPGSETIAEDWAIWRRLPFAEGIGPVLEQTYRLASALKLREVAELDHFLGEKLGAELSRSLIDAAKPFIEGKDQMRGNREWRKYCLKLENGEAPGHLPVMFALHAVMFRLPLACALQAYAWFEWKTGHLAIGKSSQAGYAEEPPVLFLDVKQEIAQIINPGPSDEDETGLRVV